MFTALTGILSSIQSLAQHQSSGGFNQQEMLMLLIPARSTGDSRVGAEHRRTCTATHRAYLCDSWWV
jgi:hypothetical protein